MKKAISTKKAPGAIGPYSQAVAANGMLYISGQIPVDPETGDIVESEIKAQTKQSLQNVTAILAEAGLTIDNVVKTTVFLSNMENFAAMNEVYASFFADPFPARAAFEVSRLPKDALVEIEAIAAFPQ